MWQVITIGILLALMIGLEEFNLVTVEDMSGAVPFTPKSLAATGFIVLAAFTTGELFKRFKIPALLGYIAAGIIFGPELIKIFYEFAQHNLPGVTEAVYHNHEPRALFSSKVIADLGLINILTVGVIGTMGGGELKISDIKDSWKLILMIIALIVVSAIPLTIGVVMGLTYLPFDLAPFLSEATTTSKLAAALLFAILAVAMSPAATLAIIQETRARGKFTSLALGIVVVADLTLVALFLVGINISKLLVAPGGFEFAKLLAALPGIGMEFAWALVVGSVTGVIFILYMRYVRREMMLFTVAIIFATSYVCSVLHAETLLAFLTAGFIVQNASRHGHDLIHELEKISTPVFIIYFMTQAAQLDLKGVVAYLPLTLILAAVRAASYYGSVRAATRMAQADENTQSWLWISFFSRGGVDLVLAAMVANAVGPDGAPAFAWGTAFQTVVMATVVVHIVAGPPLLKVALTQAGETEDARNQEGEATDSAAATSLGDLGEVEFPTPDLPHSYLTDRLLEMRDQLIELHEELIAKPLDERRRLLEESVSQLNVSVDEALDKLEALLANERYEDEEALTRAIKGLYTQSRRKLQPYIQLWERLDTLAFDSRNAEQLILAIQQLEEFDNQFVVEIEPHLYDANASERRWVRMLRKLRKLQRSLTGPGRRTVPTGRLWRYYLELSVPRYLARAAVSSAQPHERFWYELGRYLRRFDEIFTLTLEQLETPARPRRAPHPEGDEEASVEEDRAGAAAEDAGEDDEQGGAADAHHESDPHEEAHHGDGHGDAHHGDAPPADPFSLGACVEELDVFAPPRERAKQLVTCARQRHDENAAAVIACLNSWLTAATKGYSWSLQQAYTAFLDAAMCAGTMEMPALMYRPSTQFDDARRAEAKLAQRLARESDIVGAYIGWIVLDHQLALFSHWFGNYQARIAGTLDTFFGEQCSRQLERLRSRCEEGITLAEEIARDEAEPISWETWLDEELMPISHATRRALDRALISFGQGVTSRRLIDALEYRVASFSESLSLLLQDPHTTPPDASNLDAVELCVRQWFSNRLVNEIALRYIEFNERMERLVRRNLMGLNSINQVIEYNLSAARASDAETSSQDAQGEASNLESETIANALRRAERLVRQLAENMTQDVDSLKGWITTETSALSAQATDPFLEHRIGDLQRQLMRHSPVREAATRSLSSRAIAPVVSRLRGAYRALTPLYEELLEDVRDILNEEPRSEQRARTRQLLEVEPPEELEQLPQIYRRLFNPVPLDLPEFYVDRPELEARCLEAITQWGRGSRTSILLFGDRGVGKRTFIHNLIPIKIYDLATVFQRTPIQTIRLGEEIDSEFALCQQFKLLTPERTFYTLEEMTQHLSGWDERQIVIVENANKCYSRTVEGMRLCRDFLKMLNDTSEKILWVLLMDTPAATLLDTMIDLFDYFSHAFELGPFDHDAIEQMILNRHRVSGYEVDYDPPNMRLLYRTRHPLAASEAARNPRRDFFRHLGEASHGNPLLALLYWLRSIRPDLSDDTKLHVAPLDRDRSSLTEALTLRKRLILALLLQHGSLLPSELARILGLSEHEVRTELDHLTRLGYLEIIVGTDQSYQLKDLAAAEVTFELRQANLV